MRNDTRRPDTQVLDWSCSDVRQGENSQTGQDEMVQAGLLTQQQLSEKDNLKSQDSMKGHDDERSTPSHTPSHETPMSQERSLSLPFVKQQPVWSLYEKGYEIDFGGGYLWVARRQINSRGLYLVQNLGEVSSKALPERFGKIRSPYFVKCHDILQSGANTDIVLEFMNMSLVQIIAAPRPPTEQEVLAIVGQVSICSRLGCTRLTSIACQRFEGRSRCPCHQTEPGHVEDMGQPGWRREDM